ncbi:Fic family protein [Arthrobacter sp. AQ5-05]|uniref:Fic family protein n=1 Tax=Arthrobacter sp. AQ5-05 TaxID=2184581 RepID=UPI0015EC9CD8|nr:Fic family protein [Arthrobacter sp. AQ5-05]
MQTLWPIHGTEHQTWSPSGQGPKEDRIFSVFQASIPPFIANTDWVPTAELSTLCETAVIAITRLDAKAGLLLSPLTAFLLRNEAESSSKIESVEAPQIDLARAALGIRSSDHAKSTVAAADAIEDLILAAENRNPADEEALTDAHRILMKNDPTEMKHAGTFRDVQNWIGGSDYSPRNAVHVPPAPARVGSLMDDLHVFCSRTDLPVLAQAALAHGQFENIHPFTDGNGRIGRALINAILRHRGLTQSAVIPIASAFAARRDWYFEVVSAYRAGQASLLVEFLASSAIVVCMEAEASALTLAELPEQWREKAKPRGGSAAALLIDSLLATPLITVESAAWRLGLSETAANSGIQKLVETGVLKFVGRGKRDQAWSASDVTDEAEGLVQRIGEHREYLLTPNVRAHLSKRGLLGS